MKHTNSNLYFPTTYPYKKPLPMEKSFRPGNGFSRNSLYQTKLTGIEFNAHFNDISDNLYILTNYYETDDMTKFHNGIIDINITNSYSAWSKNTPIIVGSNVYKKIIEHPYDFIYYRKVRIEPDSVVYVYHDRIIASKIFAYSRQMIWSDHYVCMDAVSINGLLLRFVNKDIQTAELCIRAIENNYEAFKYIKPEILSIDICFRAVRSNPLALGMIPINLQNRDMCEWAVRRDSSTLAFVRPDLQTYDTCEDLVKLNGGLLQYVRPDLQDDDLCTYAVQSYGLAIKFVKSNLQTQEMICTAIKSGYKVWEYIRSDLKTKSVFGLAREFDPSIPEPWCFDSVFKFC
jgi:hypothetical protein